MQTAAHTQHQIFTILLLKHQQKQLPPSIVEYNTQIGRLRILKNVRSMRYSKQTIFDTMLLLLFQKSVIDMDND